MGSFGGATSPGTAYTPLVGVDLALAAGADVEVPLEPDFEYGLLASSGTATVEGAPLERGAMLYLGTGRRSLRLTADEPTRLLLLGGEPFEEQLVMWWNFVGRSGEEIADYAEQWNAESPRFGAVVGYDGDRLEAPPLPPGPAQGPRAAAVNADPRMLGVPRREPAGASSRRSRATGGPQLSNVGYSYDPEAQLIRVSVTADRAKTRNLERDPRVTLHVASKDFWTWIAVEGTADLTPVAADPNDATVEELVTYYRGISGEHPDWDEYRAAMVTDRRRVVRFRPEHVYGQLHGHVCARRVVSPSTP